MKLEESKIESYKQHIDSINTIWFSDNVGEVFLNITVLRNKIPSNIPMMDWIVKMYRWMDSSFNSIADSFYEIHIKSSIVVFFLLLLVFFLIIGLWLCVDHLIFMIYFQDCSLQKRTGTKDKH